MALVIFDTTRRWLTYSTALTILAVFLHVVFSGWFLRGFPGWNLYNTPPYGERITNIAHFWAGYVSSGVLMNFAWPRSVKGYAIPFILSWIAIAWEIFELAVGLPTAQLDTLVDMAAYGLGGLLGVYHANRSIP